MFKIIITFAILIKLSMTLPQSRPKEDNCYDLWWKSNTQSNHFAALKCVENTMKSGYFGEEFETCMRMEQSLNFCLEREAKFIYCLDVVSFGDKIENIEDPSLHKCFQKHIENTDFKDEL